MLQPGTESITLAVGSAYFINIDQQSCASYWCLLHNYKKVNIKQK